jgi:hypothetical protein
MLNGLSSTIADLRTELHALRGGYPDFVARDIDSLPAGDVPVFTFHTIEPEPFEAQLRHLQRNGYRTIDADALLRHLTGEEPAPPRAVMLTIDDGRKSIWTYGFPLLRRYGFNATVFLIPGYVPEGSAVDANLDDVWAGRIAANALGVRDPELMNWHEIRAMHASGVIDLQSHTRFHHRVPVDSSVAGFLSPRHRAHPFDLPVPSGCEGRLAAAGPAGSYGLPLFRAASLMRAQPRYHPRARGSRGLHRPGPGRGWFCLLALARRRSRAPPYLRHGGGRAWRRPIRYAGRDRRGRSRRCRAVAATGRRRPRQRHLPGISATPIPRARKPPWRSRARPALSAISGDSCTAGSATAGATTPSTSRG